MVCFSICSESKCIMIGIKIKVVSNYITLKKLMTPENLSKILINF